MNQLSSFIIIIPRAWIYYWVSEKICTRIYELPSVKINLYLHRSIINFQNHFVRASINHQFSKSFFTGINQLSCFEIPLYRHRLIIKFENIFLHPSINYQVSEVFSTCIDKLSIFETIFHMHGSIIKLQIFLQQHQLIIKFQNYFGLAWICFHVSKSFCTPINQLSSLKRILVP